MAYLPNPNPQPITGAIASTQSGAWAVTATVQGTSTVTATLSGTSAISLAAVSATQGTSPWVVSAAAVGATQGTSPWVTSITQIAGITLGATAVTNYGSTPAGVVVPAVNAFITNVPTVNQQIIGTTQSTSPWVVSAAAVGATQSGSWVVSSTQGTSPWVVSAAALGATQSGSWVVSATQGTSPWVISAAAVGATQGTSPWVVSAAAVGATQSGNWTARIVGNAGAVMDAIVTATTAPANGLAHLVIYTTNTVTSTLSTGQSISAQADYLGSMLVRPYRRSQITPAQLATLSTTTAQTLFTAGATGVYKDISSLIITPIPTATTSLPFVVNITDNTTTYHFNMQTGSSSTNTLSAATTGSIINATFNPPLPQSTTATTWMVNLNVTTCTVAIAAIAVQSMIN